MLKRLADAERDGDRIYAVIRGVGAASDGRDRSLTAPRPEGQMRALRRAYAQAGYSPATVGLVEAHGTGTVAGDGAEVTALTTVFGEFGTARQTCAIGSVKSMIGHTKATAGVAGVIKAALALHHRVLPPTIGVTEPNPKANFADSPFYVNTEARPWLASPDGHPAPRVGQRLRLRRHRLPHRARGVHRRLPAAREATVERWPGELLLWRGAPDEIADSLASLAAQLDAGAEPELADLALTLGQAAPEPTADRAALALVAESLDDLRAKLAAARELLAGDAGAAARAARHPLRADPARRRRRRRLPVPRPGLPEGRHGPGTGAGVPRSARGVRARRPRCSPAATSSRSAATCSRRRRSPTRTRRRGATS